MKKRVKPPAIFGLKGIRKAETDRETQRERERERDGDYLRALLLDLDIQLKKETQLTSTRHLTGFRVFSCNIYAFIKDRIAQILCTLPDIQLRADHFRKPVYVDRVHLIHQAKRNRTTQYFAVI